MDPDQQPIIDWVNFPAGIPTFSLWDTLHDGDLLAIESDLLARTVTLRFDVAYVRDFHHLPEQTRFIITVDGVQSARLIRSIPWPGKFSVPRGVSREQEATLIADYHRKWREESQSWSDLERLTSDGLEVSDATLGRGPGVVALQLVLMVANESHIEACVRGEAIAFHIGETQSTQEEFVALGEAYWNAFAKKRKAD